MPTAISRVFSVQSMYSQTVLSKNIKKTIKNNKKRQKTTANNKKKHHIFFFKVQKLKNKSVGTTMRLKWAFLDILGHFGTTWVILGHFGTIRKTF